MPKIFAYFCGGQTDAGGKPAMDFSKLLGFAKSTGKVCVSVFVCVCVLCLFLFVYASVLEIASEFVSVSVCIGV